MEVDAILGGEGLHGLGASQAGFTLIAIEPRRSNHGKQLRIRLAGVLEVMGCVGGDVEKTAGGYANRARACGKRDLAAQNVKPFVEGMPKGGRAANGRHAHPGKRIEPAGFFPQGGVTHRLTLPGQPMALLRSKNPCSTLGGHGVTSLKLSLVALQGNTGELPLINQDKPTRWRLGSRLLVPTLCVETYDGTLRVPSQQALRDNRHSPLGTRSIPTCVPMQSVGTRRQAGSLKL